MEDKKLTEKESLALIAEMIRNTRDRLQIGDGNILLIWGYVSSAAAVLTYILSIMTRDPRSNLIWILIPLVGLPLAKREKNRQKSETKPMTYTDKVSSGLWKITGTLAFIGTALCTGFMFYGYNSWLLMFIYALVIVGIASAFQGIVIREQTLIAGGLFSVSAGGFVTCCKICDIPVLMSWAMPLFIISFIMMTIIPGHVINYKAHRICQEN